jgi:Tol biopolymer transport system component
VVLDVRGTANTITFVQLPAVLAADHPTWSRDGQRIAFACIVETFNWDICVVDRNGTGFTRLTTHPRPDVQPAWSPDGTHIAFAAGADVAVLRVDDRTVSTLTAGSWPAWSPDGTRLAFARQDGLFTMNADGSNVTRLTTGRHYAPAWRP